MSTETQWYAACLDEVTAFLDTFAEKDARLVRIDSDLVAALTGLMQAASIQMQAMAYLARAGQVLDQLA